MSSTSATGSESYDGFFTPANDAFYRASPYSTLDRSRREIRLLKISLQADVQSNLSSQIPNINRYLDCHIQKTTSLSRAAGEYCALSYVAGDPRETAPISVNGMTFNAFSNLKHAMVHAFYHWKAAYPDKDLLLWADQICINQSDKEERGYQVGLMRDIYRCSKQTFVCLSTPRIPDCLSWAPRPGSSQTVSTSLVNESPAVSLLKKALTNFLIGEQEGAAFLQDLYSSELQDSAPAMSTSEPATGTEALVLISQSHSAVLASSMNPQLSQLIKRSRIQSGSSTNNVIGTVKAPSPERKEYMPKDSNVFQDSIRAFLTNVYWRRAWIYQELISSINICFISGNVCIPWPELLPLMNFLQIGLDPLLCSMRQSIQRRADHEIAKLEAEARLRNETRESKAEERRRQHARDVEAMKQKRKLEEQEAARLEEERRISFARRSKEQADEEKRRRIENSKLMKNKFEEWKNLRQQQNKAWESAWQEQEKNREQFHSQQLSEIRREIMTAGNNDRSLLKVLEAFEAEAVLSIDKQIEGIKENNQGKIFKTGPPFFNLNPSHYPRFFKESFQERLRRRKFAPERVRRLLELDKVPSNSAMSRSSAYHQLNHYPGYFYSCEKRLVLEFDGEGYDRSGYNLQGLNREGFDRDGRDQDGRDRDGVDLHGRDRYGFDRYGFDLYGRDRDRFDRDGRDPNGFDRDGFNQYGRDRDGFDRYGRHRDGLDRDGRDRDGYNQDGFDRNWLPRRENDPDLDPNPAAIPTARDLRDTRTANIEQLQAQLQNLDASALWSTIQGKRTIRRTTSLIPLLQHSRNCDSSDLRDRVYAFLGLAHAGYTIVPKYDATSTIETVLIETAEAIVKVDESLAILAHVQHGRNNLGCQLPTWVPDWTSRSEDSDIQKLSSLTHNAQNRAFNASKNRKAVTEFRHHRSKPSHVDMRVRGVFIDFLDQQDEAADDSSEVLIFSTGHGQVVLVPPNSHVDDQVWVLYGASKPVLLRPEGPDTYSFRGHVVVCDGEKMEESEIMFGKAVKGWYTAKDIWIE